VTELSPRDKAIALAQELRAAMDDQNPGWYEYPWEHLGDAEKDVRILIAGLLGEPHELDVLAALQHEIRDAAHEVAGILGLADSVYNKTDAPGKLWAEALRARLRVLHATLSRAPNADELRQKEREAVHVLRVREGWRSE
jgi:hypothetical protein